MRPFDNPQLTQNYCTDIYDRWNGNAGYQPLAQVRWVCVHVCMGLLPGVLALVLKFMYVCMYMRSYIYICIYMQ